MTRRALFALSSAVCLFAGLANSRAIAVTFQTQYATYQIDGSGYITSILAKTSGKQYSPAGHPSALMSLHENQKLIGPRSASFDAAHRTVTLSYPNGATALVRIEAKEKYLRLQLESLKPRGQVDAIVWGPLNTTINRLIGDIIGVVRDDDWAIGMLGLDDNTIPGPPVDGDCYGMHYYIHSPDPQKHPIPKQYKEGQIFNIGGNGINDVAFYSHPEEYFQQAFGTAIKIDPAFGTSVSYNSRDRRIPRSVSYSLLPHFPNSKPTRQQVDPVDVDFIGSGVAIYACPDDKGLDTIESIILAEGLPHPVIDGKWIRDPSGNRPDIAWYGPHDKLIEYANALDLKAVQDEGMGAYYINPADMFNSKRVGYSDGTSETIAEFTKKLDRYGIRYGLHTLCAFTQPGTGYVTPVPNPHLQTVCRSHLARPVGATDTSITITEPAFFGEKGTWHDSQKVNAVRIGTELLTYQGMTDKAPYVLQGVKRGQYGTRASAHAAGDEVGKLQMNCYHGFVPDMKLLLDEADFYARFLHEGGMKYIDFDGLESFVYQNHGYYAFNVFFRRLFDTYARLSGGKAPKVMASCVFSGAWYYLAVCNIGGGNSMFDVVNNQWKTEGKDIRYGWSDSYFPATFGIQAFNPSWTVYDIENLQAKSIGWNATYMLGLSDSVDKYTAKDELFRAFRIWENARSANVFSGAQKLKLRAMDCKFHLEQTGEKSFILHPVKEIRRDITSTAKAIAVTNPYKAQPLHAAIRIHHGAARHIIAVLPDGARIKCDDKFTDGQYIIIDGDQAWRTDTNRQKTAPLALSSPATLPAGECEFHINAAPEVDWSLMVWSLGEGERVGR